MTRQRISFFCDTQVIKFLKAKAKETGVPFSDLIRESLKPESIDFNHLKGEIRIPAEHKKARFILKTILEQMRAQGGKIQSIYLDWEGSLIAINTRPISYREMELLVHWVAALLKLEGIEVQVLPRKDVLDIGNNKYQVRNRGFDLIMPEDLTDKEFSQIARAVELKLNEKAKE